MLLENKSAVIFGGRGSIGGAVARAFAREGARVHLAGRTLGRLEQVAEEIRAAGGTAETAQVDALDKTSVDVHADAVVAGAGAIDVCFNAISLEDVHGTPSSRSAAGVGATRFATTTSAASRSLSAPSMSSAGSWRC